MDLIDYLIFGFYMVCVLGVGCYHFLRNQSTDDYYVGSRSIEAHHVGLSIVATDVGGGFSIGLGGLGFAMGLAGSWLLFTGLVGAWLSAVLIIPRIKKIDQQHGMMTYPDFLRRRYGEWVALVAAVISGIGYLGFTGAQMLAGAKLASGTILPTNPFGMDPILFSLLIIAVVTILYTVIGGLKAVIYTDTIQWIILLLGMVFVAIPVAYYKIGGWQALRAALPAEHFSLWNVKPVQFINWMITIVPIWLVAMTLYQRMYACKNEAEAKKAWFIAGLFEYPVMAFAGVFLGMCARVFFPGAEKEMAMPMLISNVLPVGVAGILTASYFSAIMSTADSCLMASSGNFVNDIIERYLFPGLSMKASIRLSMVATLVIGTLAVLLAAQFTDVLDAILYAYSFMVAGLFVPTLGAYFWPRGSNAGALAGMLCGGTVAVLFLSEAIPLPQALARYEFDASLYGIFVSAIVYIGFSLIRPDAKKTSDEPTVPAEEPTDRIERLDGATIQHGPLSDRVYLMKLGSADPAQLIPELRTLAEENGYTKIFAKAPASVVSPFLKAGYRLEAEVPGFYGGEEAACFLGRYFSSQRQQEGEAEQLDAVLQLAREKQIEHHGPSEPPPDFTVVPCREDRAEAMSEIYRRVFPSYPFPIDDAEYLRRTMRSHVVYFGAEHQGRLVALSSAEMDQKGGNVEMTDFATLPEFRGRGLAVALLGEMEREMRRRSIRTAYTIARAVSPGMNITFAKRGYRYAGRLINNTNIGGQIESMNVWYKPL